VLLRSCFAGKNDVGSNRKLSPCLSRTPGRKGFNQPGYWAQSPSRTFPNGQANRELFDPTTTASFANHTMATALTVWAQFHSSRSPLWHRHALNLRLDPTSFLPAKQLLLATNYVGQASRRYRSWFVPKHQSPTTHHHSPLTSHLPPFTIVGVLGAPGAVKPRPWPYRP
jgi:hypothetical protein